MHLVGICGGSGSGKTTILKRLRAHFSQEQLSFISQDDYYLPVERDEDNHKIDFDRPEAINLNGLYDDILLLRRGQSLTRSEYTFNNPSSASKTKQIDPAEVMIIEGLFILCEERFRDLFDTIVFITAEEDIRFARRMKRDIEERGYSEESIRYKWENQVENGYRKYTLPYMKEADIIIDSTESIDKGLTDLIRTIESEMIQK